MYDHQIYELIGFSGHSLKHLIAAFGAFLFLKGLEVRKPIKWKIYQIQQNNNSFSTQNLSKPILAFEQESDCDEELLILKLFLKCKDLIFYYQRGGDYDN